MNKTGSAAVASGPAPLGHRGGARRHRERIIALALAACAAVSVLITLALLGVFLSETVAFFSQVSLWEFLSETRWSPLFREKHFGILPLLSGSILVAGGAALVALPLGALSAVFLSEYAQDSLRSLLKPFLEVLAGIPTVVYGYFALTFVTPVLQAVFPGIGTYNAAAAGIVLGIMVLPTVASHSEDALRAVPRRYRVAAMSLGATKAEVTTRLIIPAGMSGILTSFIFGISRALGETMAVTMAAGNSPRLTLNPLDAVQTLSAFMVQAGQGSIQNGTLEYRTLMAVGMTLLGVTLVMNLAAQWVRAHFAFGGERP